MNFFNLHAHTCFGLSDGYGNPGQISTRLKEISQDGIAITDHGTIAGHRSFATHFEKTGQHLVYGCEMYIVDSLNMQYSHAVILAKTKEGYKNLHKLIMESFNPHYTPRITLPQIIARSNGLIILSGCLGNGIFIKKINGIFTKKISEQSFKNIMESFSKIEWYIELQPFKDEQVKWDYLVNMANKYSLPCLVTADCHYPRPKDSHTYAGTKPGYPLHIPSADEILARCKAMGRFKEKWIRDTYDVAHSCKVELK